jgi:hypothetical protein
VGLHQLCTPMLDRLDVLPELQQVALTAPSPCGPANTTMNRSRASRHTRSSASAPASTTLNADTPHSGPAAHQPTVTNVVTEYI